MKHFNVYTVDHRQRENEEINATGGSSATRSSGSHAILARQQKREFRIKRKPRRVHVPPYKSDQISCGNSIYICPNI